jgi:hypothetical protein
MPQTSFQTSRHSQRHKFSHHKTLLILPSFFLFIPRGHTEKLCVGGMTPRDCKPISYMGQISDLLFFLLFEVWGNFRSWRVEKILSSIFFALSKGDEKYFGSESIQRGCHITVANKPFYSFKNLKKTLQVNKLGFFPPNEPCLKSLHINCINILFFCGTF